MARAERNIWDWTRIALSTTEERSNPLTDKQLWTLHAQVWRKAFESLGKGHKMDLYQVDPHVTLQPKHPSMWFYPGEELSAVSMSELEYAFPADEFKNPEFAYIPVHHWFRLGLAVGRDGISKILAKKNLAADLPTVEKELVQTTFVLVMHAGKYHQVLGSEAGDLSLLSAEGWTKVADLNEPAREQIIGAWRERRCLCGVCARLRPKGEEPSEKSRWAHRLVAMQSEHGEGAALLEAMLELHVTGAMDWAVVPWLDKQGAAIVATVPKAAKIVERSIASDDVARRRMGATLLAGAMKRANAEGKEALLAAVLLGLQSTDDVVVERVLRIPLTRKQLSGEVFAALVELLQRYSYHEQAMAALAELFDKNLDWRKAKEPRLPEVARAMLDSPFPAVRRRIARVLKVNLAKTRQKFSPNHAALLAELVAAAERELTPEIADAVLKWIDDIPEALSRLLADALAKEIDPSDIDIFELFERRRTHAELDEACLRMLTVGPDFRRANAARAAGRNVFNARDARAWLALMAKALLRLDEVDAVISILEAVDRVYLDVYRWSGNDEEGRLAEDLSSVDGAERRTMVDSVAARAASWREEGRSEDAARLESFHRDQPRRLLASAMAAQYDAATMQARAVARAPLDDPAPVVEVISRLWARRTFSPTLSRKAREVIAGGHDSLVVAHCEHQIHGGLSSEELIPLAMGWSAALNDLRAFDSSVRLLHRAHSVHAHADFLYNEACAYARRGDVEDSAATLARSIEMSPANADDARNDQDFAALREHPAFVALLGPPA